MVLVNRKLKLRKKTDTLKISEDGVITIFRGYLSTRKVCSKLIPQLLTVVKRQQRVDNSEPYLELFQCNKKDFSMRYLTMDETWIHHYTPESNRQSV